MNHKSKHLFLASALTVATVAFAGGASANTETDKILNYYNQYSSQAPVVNTTPSLSLPSQTVSPVTSTIDLDSLKTEISGVKSVDEMLLKILTLFNNQQKTNSGSTVDKKEPYVEGYTPTTIPVTTTAINTSNSYTVIKGPTEQNIDNMIIFGNDTAVGLASNDDSVRRSTLESMYGIQLTDKEVWSGSNQDGTNKDPDGNYYTSTETMKNLKIYATNASRNELIDYAIKNDNWQPYRWFEAMRTPAYFEYVNGKLEYNKNYWAWLFNGLRSTYVLQLDAGLITQAEYNSFVKEYVDKFNKAPGYAVYATHLNHTEEIRKETGAIAPNPNFDESIWNSPQVVKGQFKDGYNPFVELRAALNKQNTN